MRVYFFFPFCLVLSHISFFFFSLSNFRRPPPPVTPLKKFLLFIHPTMIRISKAFVFLAFVGAPLVLAQPTPQGKSGREGEGEGEEEGEEEEEAAKIEKKKSDKRARRGVEFLRLFRGSSALSRARFCSSSAALQTLARTSKHRVFARREKRRNRRGEKRTRGFHPARHLKTKLRGKKMKIENKKNSHPGPRPGCRRVLLLRRRGPRRRPRCPGLRREEGSPGLGPARADLGAREAGGRGRRARPRQAQRGRREHPLARAGQQRQRPVRADPGDLRLW